MEKHMTMYVSMLIELLLLYRRGTVAVLVISGESPSFGPLHSLWFLPLLAT